MAKEKSHSYIKGIEHTAKDSKKKKMPKTKSALHKALEVPKGKEPKMVRMK